MLQRSWLFVVIAGVAALLSGCGNTGKKVYVLEASQSVSLTPSASAQKVQHGAQVVLHVERRTVGKWKLVSLQDVSPGQCWVYQPPMETEEAADQVEWRVEPEGAVAFNREVRLDRTKIAIMRSRGIIRLMPRTAVPCEPDRVVEGPPITIEVS